MRNISTIILIKDNGDALLQLRDNVPHITNPNIWTFPGGCKEDEEDFYVAAIRELKEETGYISKKLKFLGKHFIKQSDLTNETIYFFMDIYDGVQKISCYEGQKMEFTSRNEADTKNLSNFLIKFWDKAIKEINK